jgi:hypothetical protein
MRGDVSNDIGLELADCKKKTYHEALPRRYPSGDKKYQRPNDYIGIGQLGRLSLLFAEAIFKSSRSALYAFFVLNDTEHLTV